MKKELACPVDGQVFESVEALNEHCRKEHGFEVKFTNGHATHPDEHDDLSRFADEGGGQGTF